MPWSAVSATTALYATATYFQTEGYFDYVTIGGTRFSTNGAGPQNVQLGAGKTMSWSTDSSVTRAGILQVDMGEDALSVRAWPNAGAGLP